MVLQPTAHWGGFTPVALTLHQFKLESGINGAPYGLPPIYSVSTLEMVTLRAKEVTVFCL